MSVKTTAGTGAAVVTGTLPYTGYETWAIGIVGMVALLLGLGAYAITNKA